MSGNVDVRPAERRKRAAAERVLFLTPGEVKELLLLWPIRAGYSAAPAQYAHKCIYLAWAAAIRACRFSASEHFGLTRGRELAILKKYGRTARDLGLENIHCGGKRCVLVQKLKTWSSWFSGCIAMT